MTGPIYRPKGRAKEYAPLALNYFDSCSGGCKYCYTEGLWPGFTKQLWTHLRKGFTFDRLENQLKTFQPEPGEYVLLCFAGDPYCRAEKELRATQLVLELFLEHRIPTRILTKMGTECLRDIDLFEAFKSRGVPIMVGQTLTFRRQEDSLKWEPGGALPDDRLRALWILHEYGIPTWASFEPVIDPAQSLALMRMGLGFIDYFAIGKLNHHPDIERGIDWKEFGEKAVALMKEHHKPFLIKHDLKARMVA